METEGALPRSQEASQFTLILCINRSRDINWYWLYRLSSNQSWRRGYSLHSAYIDCENTEETHFPLECEVAANTMCVSALQSNVFPCLQLTDTQANTIYWNVLKSSGETETWSVKLMGGLYTEGVREQGADLRGRRWQDNGEDCIVNSFIICTLHQIFWGGQI
jgi:hypothetical protein